MENPLDPNENDFLVSAFIAVKLSIEIVTQLRKSNLSPCCARHTALALALAGFNCVEVPLNEFLSELRRILEIARQPIIRNPSSKRINPLKNSKRRNP